MFLELSRFCFKLPCFGSYQFTVFQFYRFSIYRFFVCSIKYLIACAIQLNNSLIFNITPLDLLILSKLPSGSRWFCQIKTWSALQKKALKFLVQNCQNKFAICKNLKTHKTSWNRTWNLSFREVVIATIFERLMSLLSLSSQAA